MTSTYARERDSAMSQWVRDGLLAIIVMLLAWTGKSIVDLQIEIAVLSQRIGFSQEAIRNANQLEIARIIDRVEGHQTRLETHAAKIQVLERILITGQNQDGTSSDRNQQAPLR